MIDLTFLLARGSDCSYHLFGSKLGPSLYDGLCNGKSVDIQGPGDVLILLTNVIAILIAAAGALGIIFLIVGGIFYVTSTGDPSRIKRAKDIVVQAVVGLIVVSVAYAAVTFISGSLK